MYSSAQQGRFFTTALGPSQKRQEAAEELIHFLVNSILVIRANRFLGEENISEKSISLISSQEFKNWLLTMSRSRGEKFETYNNIVDLFSNKPYEYGKLHPFVEDNKVGIVVYDNNGRELVIERLGTGIHQILLLLSNIVCSKAKIIGIEEIELNLSPSLQHRTVTMLKGLVGKSPEKQINQLFLTSHSFHLSTRQDVVLFAVQLNENRGTEVKWGAKAIAELPGYFDYGLIKIPGKKIWRK